MFVFINIYVLEQRLPDSDQTDPVHVQHINQDTLSRLKDVSLSVSHSVCSEASAAPWWWEAAAGTNVINIRK